VSFDASGDYVPEPEPDIRITPDSVELTIHVCMPSLGEPCGRPCHRCAITDHEFLETWAGVDWCGFGGAFTRCSATRARHVQPEPEPEECETCHGSGRVDRGIGRGHYTDSCDDCDGQGVREVEQ
jgi:hypothetical protein